MEVAAKRGDLGESTGAATESQRERERRRKRLQPEGGATASKQAELLQVEQEQAGDHAFPF